MQEEGFEFPSNVFLKEHYRIRIYEKKEENNKKEAFSLANYLRTKLTTSKGV